MTDTARQLRFWGGNGETESQTCMLQAADEIERLCERNKKLERGIKAWKEQSDMLLSTLREPRKPSDYCCLNYGCPNPEVCDASGYSCGDPNRPTSLSSGNPNTTGEP